MLCQFSAPWEAAPTELSESIVSVVSVIICLASLIVLPNSLVMKDPMEVCPLSREGCCCFERTLYPFHYRAAFAFSIILYPHPRRSLLRNSYPFGETYGLTTFCTRAWT